jgi:hypothetical protein
MYKFSKNGRLFVQGTKLQDDPGNVNDNLVTQNINTDCTTMDIQAIHIKRKMCTEVLGIHLLA